MMESEKKYHDSNQNDRERERDKFLALEKTIRFMAHEIRNPLTNINLAVEELRASDEKVTSRNQTFDMILRNSERINSIMSQMLSALRYEPASLKLNSLNQLVEETLQIVDDQLQLHKITVIKKLSEQDSNVSIDIERVKTALLNLIINSIEAMDTTSGVLTITTEVIDNLATISISDNGKGIDPEKIDNLFVSFHTNKSKNIGLGLAAAQRIVIGNNGLIRAKRQEGKGSVFSIEFPI